MLLLNIGFSSMVSIERIIAIISPDSAPIKRLVQESKERGTAIDATYGHKTKAVIIMDSDNVILSALTPDILNQRITERQQTGENNDGSM